MKKLTLMKIQLNSNTINAKISFSLLIKFYIKSRDNEILSLI